jgi:hypothetical protein
MRLIMKMAIDMTDNTSCPNDIQLQSFNIKHRHSLTLGYFRAAQFGGGGEVNSFQTREETVLEGMIAQ